MAPTSGGEPRQVVRIDDGLGVRLAWTPDGRALLFTRKGPEKKRELWRVSAQKGEPERLGLVMNEMQDIAVHRDGKRIAIGVMQYEPEIWVMENFLPTLRVAKRN